MRHERVRVQAAARRGICEPDAARRMSVREKKRARARGANERQDGHASSTKQFAQREQTERTGADRDTARRRMKPMESTATGALSVTNAIVGHACGANQTGRHDAARSLLCLGRPWPARAQLSTSRPPWRGSRARSRPPADSASGIALVVGGPALVSYVTPSPEQLRQVSRPAAGSTCLCVAAEVQSRAAEAGRGDGSAAREGL